MKGKGKWKGAFLVRMIILSVKMSEKKVVAKALLLHIQMHKNTYIQSRIHEFQL